MLRTASAAMLLLFDVDSHAIVEHDDWHTHEHMPERLSLPGFLRASRWVARSGTPRYLVMYEVRDLDMLVAAPYLARLNDPTPWTAKMMRSYVGMRRALCKVEASAGAGLGRTALLARFTVDEDRAGESRDWLAREILPALAGMPGIASVDVVAQAVAAPMTREQRIRGNDAGLDHAVLVTGYEAGALAEIAGDKLHSKHFVARGAAVAEDAIGLYDQAVSMTAGDISRQ
ncbi:MAG TPA: hypothetical protein VGI14_16460 [Casimicrobiaceae bacterium]|jgi:hypothetical protein